MLTIKSKQSCLHFDNNIDLQLTYDIQMGDNCQNTAILWALTEKTSCMILDKNLKSYRFDVQAGIQQSC